MPYEDKKIECPVCGRGEIIKVKYHGDSDGNYEIGRMNPDDCIRCKGWKEASPVLYKALRDHFDRAEQIKEQTESRMRLEYEKHIPRWMLSDVICDPFSKENRFLHFQKSLQKYNEVTLKTENKKNTDWAINQALQDTICLFSNQLESRK